MRLIRHILSHLLLMSVIAGLVVIYYFRNQVLPVQYVQKIDHYAEKVHPRLLSFAHKQQADTSSVMAESGSVQQEVKPAETPEVVVIEETQTQAEETVTTVQPEVPVNVVSEDVAEVKQEEPTVATVSDVASADDKKPTDEVAIQQPVATVTENAEQAPANDKEASSSNELLKSARTAFNNGELDVAITKYNELIELENDEADFYGELGNVHYSMGSWDKAGEAYYEAATRLIETGRLAQVLYLQRVLQGLDAERAGQLAAKMAKVQQGM